jgi:hypothetical protein
VTTRTDPARKIQAHPLDDAESSEYRAGIRQLSTAQLRTDRRRLVSLLDSRLPIDELAVMHGKIIAISKEIESRGEDEDSYAWKLFKGVALLICILAVVSFCSGCASTHTVLRIGLHADLTDVVNGCDRKLDAYCGLKGPRDIAVIEFLYLPTARFDRTFNPYVGWLHKSHYSAGFPVNKEFEQIVDAPGLGGFIQFGGRK